MTTTALHSGPGRLDAQMVAGERLQAPASLLNDRATCRFCSSPLHFSLVDLGMSPLCESYVSRERLNEMEPFYPLHVYVCGTCYLVQIEAYVSAADIFSDYAYFSSFSDSWVEHARAYSEQMVERFGLNGESHIVEVASNDGYLLKHFVARGLNVLGIEPAVNVAAAAERVGVPTIVDFFGARLASELTKAGKQADLLLGNNVLAQVPDVNDFVRGMKLLLKPGGVITAEFPHVMRTLEGNQFDQIYHEHFSYFSFLTVKEIFSAHGLALFDVDELPTHGGSLRIYARHIEDDSKPITQRVESMLAAERAAGLDRLESYATFGEKVKETKRMLLQFLIDAKREGKKVVGYGAPGKGNTLLNYCGIRSDFLDFTVDRSPHKQGKFLPGTHVPILHPDAIREARPDYVLILPWNLAAEIKQQIGYVREWGGRFVVPIPTVRVED